jgi:tetratricopeptide (TPR) repeat protein
MALRQVLVVIGGLLLGAGSAQADSVDLSQYLDRAHALNKAGKHDQALPYLLQALELGEVRYAADDGALVMLLDTLAETYSAQGSFDDAEPLLKRSLTIQERTLVNTQTGIARTLTSLGFVYESTGRRAEASKLYSRVLAVWQPKLGADDPSVRAAQEGLAKLASTKAILDLPSESSAAITAALPSAGAYRIHLTSIRNAAGADREWARLVHEYPDLLAGMDMTVSKADLGGDRGVFYRIQGGPLSKRAALDRCLEFAKRALWCRVVQEAADTLAGMLPPKLVEPGAAPGGERVASVEAPARTGYRIHLTSIRDPERAGEEWGRLRHLYPALLGGLDLEVERADLGAERGVYFRIEGGPLSRAEAQTVCGEFAALRLWCGIVPPARGAADVTQNQLIGRIRRPGSGSASATWRPDTPRRRRRIDRSRPEPGTRRYGRPRRTVSQAPVLRR